MLTVLAFKQTPESATGPGGQLLGWLSWLVALICVATLIVVAGGMAYNRQMGRPSLEESAGRVAIILISAVVLGSASAIAGAILTFK
mgnify:FL=1